MSAGVAKVGPVELVVRTPDGTRVVVSTHRSRNAALRRGREHCSTNVLTGRVAAWIELNMGSVSETWHLQRRASDLTLYLRYVQGTP